MIGALADLGRNWTRLARISGIRGKSRGLLLNIVVIGAFGVAIPWRKSLDFFDPFILFAYSLIPLLYAIPAVSDLLGGSSGSDLEGIPAKALASAAYAWVVLAVIYALAFVTVNLLYRTRFFHPAFGLLGSAALFGFAVALFVAGLTALLAVLFSPAAARSAMRLVVLTILLALAVSSRWLPQAWQIRLARQYTTQGLTRFGLIGSAVLLVLSAGLLLALHRPQGGRQRL